MTSTRSSSTNTKARSATRRIESFRQRFGDGHFYLACHAALLLALTPDLLYSLWANFQRDIHDEAIDIPWIAVADLMLSSLCKEVGNELYEIDQAARDDLLNQLQNDSRFGLERLRELADFVMAYVEQQLDSPDLDVRDLAQGQQWRALTYKNPSEAAHRIATVLAQLPFDDKAEWIRMAALLNSLSEPLSAFQPLLNYIRAMADLARGNLAAATDQMTQAVDTNNQVRVEGVNLPIPDVLNGQVPKSQEPDALPTSPPNRLRVPIAIAGATIASVLILLGVQYGLRSPDSQQTPDVTSSATPSPQTPSPSISSRPSPRTEPAPKGTTSGSRPVQQTLSPSTSKLSPSSTLLPQSNSTSTQKTRSTRSPTVSAENPLPKPSPTTTSSTQEQPQVVAPPVTFEQIMQMVPDASPDLVRQLVPYLNQAMAQYGINTRLRQAHFLAQVAHESDHFNALEQLDSEAAVWEGRDDLGNTQPGDGVRFKGRGLLQVVGRTNYTEIGTGLGVDLIKNPTRLADPDLAVLSAAWYWSKNQLNDDADMEDVKTVTRVINGGYNGLADRIKLLQAAKKALGI